MQPSEACSDDSRSRCAQLRHVARWLPDVPPKLGTTYRVLFGGALADVMHFRCTVFQPLHTVTWLGSGATRNMQITLLLRQITAQRTCIEARWLWEWRGWRRLPRAAASAHALARAVGAQAEASIAAAFATGLHTAPSAYVCAALDAHSPVAAATREEIAAAAAAEEEHAASVSTWPPGASDAEPPPPPPAAMRVSI